MMDIIINQIVRPHFNEKKNYFHVNWQILLSYVEILLCSPEFRQNPFSMTF